MEANTVNTEEVKDEAKAVLSAEEKEDLVNRVNESLGEIKQILAQDGGGIELVDITDDMIAQVRLQGHCVGCMGARMTMSGIVEQILQDQVPEIKGAEAVD